MDVLRTLGETALLYTAYSIDFMSVFTTIFASIDASEFSVAAPVPVRDSRSTEAIDEGEQQADEMVPERQVESQQQVNTQRTRMQRSSSAQTRSRPCGMCKPCKRENCGICENCR